MARIRDDFWDSIPGLPLSYDGARLLMDIVEVADDEGLIPWFPDYFRLISAPVAWDMPEEGIRALMQDLADRRILVPYRCGKPQRRSFAWVPKISLFLEPGPTKPSRYPAPPLQNGAVYSAYLYRDGMVCHLCEGWVEDWAHPHWAPSLDHLVPRSKGGSDYPSNIKLSHQTCNKARCDRPIGVSRSRHAAPKVEAY